ncbi:AraC family transcriptional regulator [Variovorax sp. DXTD-1]|uniref:AraC family transcriptional regulator n=1 Tax=Variovorax sp. DXTD-1 TaxID=2495592 RepID=UPI0021AEFEAF|nr:AraC family transcriptional regulator [Variovorax sp. DXTD-1]
MKSAGLKGTVSIELVHEAIHAAALRNMDISCVLESAKLDRDLLNAPRARISAAAYSRMWVALARVLGRKRGFIVIAESMHSP